MTFLKLYAISIPVFLVIDLLWIGLVAQKFYQNQIGHLLKTDVNWWAAIAFYLVFLVGVVQFVVLPAIEKQSASHAILYGALFGLVTYSAYDLTNLAVAKDWPLTVTVVDLLWGSILCMLVSFITYKIGTMLIA